MVKLQKRLRRCKRAVSDIIGNLLILAITVTLFSSVLYFVTSMPSPQEQTYADMTYDVSPVLADGSRWVNVTHAGGQPLRDYAISIALFKNDTLFKVLNLSDSTSPLGDEWITGETWTYLVTGVTEDTSLSMYILDNDKNTIVWESNLVGGMIGGGFAPIIGTRGTNPSPVTDQKAFRFYAIVTDPDGDLDKANVYINASSIGLGAHISLTDPDNDGLFVSSEYTGSINFNGKVVLVHAYDVEGRNRTAILTITAQEAGSAGGDQYYGPFNNYSSYFVNGTYPPDATGGESSGQDGGVGTTFYYIRRLADGAITRDFVAGEGVMVEVYSNALRNLALDNEFYIYHPITGMPITPQSTTEAFSYGGIFGTFYRFVYNFTAPSENYIYPIQFKLKDNFGTVVNVADTIVVGAANYPELVSYKYVSSSSIVQTGDFNHTDWLYLQIKTKDVDLSAATLYVSDVQISDYSGRYIIKKSPPSYTAIPTYSDASKPVSSPFKASSTSPVAAYSGTNNGVYTLYIGLKDAYQGWWLPKKNAYTVKITLISDQGTGGTTGEVYHSLTCQINVTAPLSTTDILASVGSGSFTWSSSGAQWSDNKIAWYKGGEQWDETVIDPSPNQGPIGLALADIDGDGDDDVVVGTQDPNYANIVWYENQKSDGSAWSSARAVVMPFDALAGTQAANTASTSNTNEDVSVYKTASTDQFYGNDGDISIYEICGSVKVGDFDNDGDGDIAASFLHVVVYTTALSRGSADYSNTFGMYFNRGVYVFWNDGSWTKTTLYGTNDWIAANIANDNTNPAVLNLEVGDFNQDGCDDIVGVYETGKTSVWLSRWPNTVGSITAKETGAFSTASSLKTVPNVAGNNPWSHVQYIPVVDVADMNNDGYPDIVRSSTSDRSVTVFYTQGSVSDAVYYAPNAEWNLKADPAKITGSRANLVTTDGVYEVLYETYQNYTAINATVSAIGAADNTLEPITDLQTDNGILYRVENGKTMAIDAFNINPAMNGKTVTSVKLVVKYTVGAGYAQTNKVQWAFNGGSFVDSTIQPATGTNVVVEYDLFAQGVDTWTEITTLDVRFQNSDAVPVDFDYVFIKVKFVETCSLAWEWSIANELREYHDLIISAKRDGPSAEGFKLEYSVDNTTWFFLTYINSTTMTEYTFPLTYTTNTNYYFRLTDFDRSTTDVVNDSITIDRLVIKHSARAVLWNVANKYSAVVPVGAGEFVTALAIGDLGRFTADYTPDGLKDIIVGTSKVGNGDDSHTLYQMTQISWNNYDMKAIYTTNMAIMCSDNAVYDLKNIALGDTDGDGDLDIVVVVGNAFGRQPGTGPTMWHYENNNIAPLGSIWQYSEEYVNILASKGESAINVETGEIDLTIFMPLIGVMGVVVMENLLRRMERKRRP